jgi:hypothetical protein
MRKKILSINDSDVTAASTGKNLHALVQSKVNIIEVSSLIYYKNSASSGYPN